MTTSKKYLPTGGIAVYDGVTSSLQELKTATSYEKVPSIAPVDVENTPSLPMVVIPGTTNNQLSAVSGNYSSSGVAMLVTDYKNTDFFLPAGAKTVTATAGTTATGTTTLYTVPAGKTLYITSLCFAALAGATSSGIAILIWDETAAAASAPIMTACGIGVTQQINCIQNFAVPIRVPATKLVQLDISGTALTRGNFDMIGYLI
jgi:hypothetical protein